MWESWVVAKALEWVGQSMHWVGQSSGLSNFGPVMRGEQQAPPSGLTPSMGWSMTCYEMPLLAGVNVRAITQQLAGQVAANPQVQLKRYSTIEYGQSRWFGTGHPVAGDLVFWKQELPQNSLFVSAFGGLAQGQETKWGLDHVALATGKRRDYTSEIISFWEDGVITLTDVRTVTNFIESRVNAEMYVTYASGPWAYY